MIPPECTESFQNQQLQDKKVMIVTVERGPDEMRILGIQIPLAAPLSISESMTLVLISLQQMHQEGVPLTKLRDECPTSTRN